MDERTIEISKRFSDSWTETENRFDYLINSSSGFEFLKAIRQLMATMKKMAKTNTFELGHPCIL